MVEERRREGPTEEEVRNAVPAEAEGREFRVGIFVLLGIAAFLTALFLLTDPATFRGRYMVTTTVEDAGGLRQGDPVLMRGVNVGRVHRFTMSPEGNVTVTLELEGEWEIPADSRAELAPGGLLGGRTVEIVPGSSDQALEPGGHIPGEVSVGLLDSAGELSDEALEVMARVEALLSEPTVEAVQGSVLELRATLEQLRELTRVQGGEIAELTASLNRSAESLEVATDAAPEAASAVARADSALLRLNRTSATLEDAVASLDSILERVQRGEGTLGQLTTDDALYDQLTEAARSVSMLATDIRENPDRYVRIRIF